MKRKLHYIYKILKNIRKLKSIIDRYFFFIENRHQTLWGSITDEEQTGLIMLIDKAASIPGPIIEIGSLFGLTTQFIASHKPIDKELIAIENFTWNPFLLPEEDHRTFTKRVLYHVIRHCNTHLFERSNLDFYNSYHGCVPSMIFIDANHSYNGVMTDIKWAIEKKIPIISGHDYSELCPGVVRAVDETFGDRIIVHGSVWASITKCTPKVEPPGVLEFS